jgi:peptidoglycan/xylan/chitin deacetylase (PgdA/CDA1 family)
MEKNKLALGGLIPAAMSKKQMPIVLSIFALCFVVLSMAGLLKKPIDIVQQQLNVRLNQKKAVLTNERPLICFTFDDFPESAYTSGGAVLKKYNLHGTYYVAMGLEGATNHLGRHYDLEMLRKVAADGHEIGSHGFAHTRCSKSSKETIKADFEKNQTSCDQTVAGRKLANFSYPFGDVSVAAKSVVNDFYSSSRGINGGLNCGVVDLNLLKANQLYSRIPLEKAFALIEENQAKNGWLIFYTHDVTASPSKYGCTPEYLEQVIQKAIESGAEIVTVQQALKFARPVK